MLSDGRHIGRASTRLGVPQLLLRVAIVVLLLAPLTGCIVSSWLQDSDWILDHAREIFGGEWALSPSYMQGVRLDTVAVAKTEMSDSGLDVFVDIVYVRGEQTLVRRHRLTFCPDWKRVAWKPCGHSTPPLLNNDDSFFVSTPGGGTEGYRRWRNR